MPDRSRNRTFADSAQAYAVDFDRAGCVDFNDMNLLLALYSVSSPAAKLGWDAENRLTLYEPLMPVEGSQKVAFQYNYLSRRVEKKVWDWDDTNEEWESTPSDWRKFVWYNWLLLEELECDVSDGSIDAVIRKYTWGLDLAGQSGGVNPLESAGGIGGLLATYDVSGSDDYLYLYDANGNVGQLLDWSAGTTVAEYEYDPYGNVLSSTETYADDNPFRFSTKYWDDETGMGYWGYRYYDPRLGRWISEDRIGELGGFALYCYVRNSPLAILDSLGDHPFGGFPVENPRPPQPPAPPSGGHSASSSFTRLIASLVKAAAPKKGCVERSFDLAKSISGVFGEPRGTEWYVTRSIKKTVS